MLPLGFAVCSDPVQDDLIKISELEDGVIEGCGSVTG